MEGEIILAKGWKFRRKHRPQGFTLVELMVVIAGISMLMGLMLPVLSKARRMADSIRNVNNQRQITQALFFYSADNDGWYPKSVATVGFDDIWNWSDPRKLIGKHKRTPVSHRAMSEYLGKYIKDAGIMFCPNAPFEYKYLQQAWQAGDQWDNPDTALPRDPLGGTYCFWWNYIGYLGPRKLFVGPSAATGDRHKSRLLVSDFFGYGQCQNRSAFGSCEELKNASVTDETWLLSSYWSCEGDLNSQKPEVTLSAGYTDGHVQSYSSLDVVLLRVSKTSDGRTPYPDPPLGLGIFFVPQNCMH